MPREQGEELAKAGMRGKAVMITGGATGIGRATALAFARRGVNVAFNYIDLPGRDIGAQAILTETTLRSYGVSVYSDACDVRDGEAVHGFVEAARGELGGLHYLVNNAGITRDAALWRLPEKEWREVLDTNLTGAYHCLQATARVFRAQHYGKVVNIASHLAFWPSFGVSAYAASKAALVGLTKSAAVELGPSGVNVNGVAPGYVHTELLDGLPEDVVERAKREAVLGRLAEPEDVAHVVVFLCSEEARHITGQVILVDGGLSIA